MLILTKKPIAFQIGSASQLKLEGKINITSNEIII